MVRVLLFLLLSAGLYIVVTAAIIGQTGDRVDLIGSPDQRLYVKHCVYYRLWPPYDYEAGQPQPSEADAWAIPCPSKAWSLR